MIGLLVVAGLSLVIAGLGALLLREARQSYRYRQCLRRCSGRAYDIEVTARRTANPRMIMVAGQIQDDVQKALDA